MSPTPATCPWCAICPPTFLSRVVDVSKYGIIFGGAQKNLAPAGLTIAIVREDLAGHELPYTPLMMNYKTMIDKDSMYNTPALLVHLHAGAGAGVAGRLRAA